MDALACATCCWTLAGTALLMGPKRTVPSARLPQTVTGFQVPALSDLSNRSYKSVQYQICPVRYALGANREVSESDPMAHLPAAAAVWIVVGLSTYCARTSAPTLRRLCAACFSSGGLYQFWVHTSLTVALGLAALTPSANPLMA